jgi:hypothetical protein
MADRLPDRLRGRRLRFTNPTETSVKSVERHRALRKPFVGAIAITDVTSERQMSAHTSSLSVHGCFVPTPTPLISGAQVRITIVHAGAKVVAFGHVIYARAEGMGIAFTKIEPSDQAVLERWMTNLRVK